MTSRILVIISAATTLVASAAFAQPLSRTVGFARASEDSVVTFLLLNQMREQNAESEHLRRRQMADDQDARRKAQEREDLAKRVGRRIARGECTGAERLALNEGDFEMARRAADLCTQQGKADGAR